MKTRTTDEIERAFRDMGLTEATWGRADVPDAEAAPEPPSSEQVFIRIETTTTPLETKPNADVA